MKKIENIKGMSTSEHDTQNMDKHRNKNKDIKNLAIALAILILTFTLFVFLVKYRGKIKNIAILTVSNLEDTENKQKGSEYYVVKNILKDTGDYTVNVFYPETKSKSLNQYIYQKIKSYIKDIKYISEYAEIKNDAHKYSLNISFDMYRGRDSTISFAFWVIYDTNYLHANRGIFTVIYDIDKDKILQISDFENKYESFLVDLAEYTYRELKQNERITSIGAYDMLDAGTLPNKYNYTDMVMSGDNIIVMFETYKVAPYVAGEFEVKVPLSYFKEK